VTVTQMDFEALAPLMQRENVTLSMKSKSYLLRIVKYINNL